MGLFRKENMEARVTISEETMKKAEKINNRKKGALRYQRLVEIAQNGTLQKCKSRVDVALACGYTEQQKPAGYAWTKNLVKTGKLVEHLAGRDPLTNQPEYEYSLGGKKVEKVEKEEPKVEPKAETVLSMYGIGNTTTMVAIKKGDLSVEITGAPVEYAKTIIETIIKK